MIVFFITNPAFKVQVPTNPLFLSLLADKTIPSRRHLRSRLVTRSSTSSGIRSALQQTHSIRHMPPYSTVPHVTLHLTPAAQFEKMQRYLGDSRVCSHV